MHEARLQAPIFSDLVDDILHVICSELCTTSRASLQALAQVSPSLNAIATPYIFQNLLIRPGREGTQERKAYKVLLQRLRGKAGSKLAKNVRHLRVDGFDSVANLEAILVMCNNIGHFSWYSHAQIPSSILRILQTTMPDARITVRNYHREHAYPSLSVTDEALLSCPQLVDLEYVIDDVDDVGSELRQLLKLLQAGAHCRSLRIDTRKAGYQSDQLWNGFNVALPLLEDVILISKAQNGLHYNTFSVADTLIRGRNLRRLELPLWTYSLPQAYGNYRNLRFLRVSTGNCDGHELASLCFLLKSDEVELQGLFIEDMSLGMDQLWPALQKQQHSLRALALPMSQGNRSKHYYRRFLGVGSLVAISKTFTALDRLALDVPLAPEGGPSDPEFQLDEAYVSQLTKLNLKTLDLYVFLPRNRDTVFAPNQAQNEPLGSGLDIEGTLRAGLAIAEKISDSQNHPLQTLALHISTEGDHPKEAKVQLERIDRDDTCALGIRKYRVIKRCEWREPDEWDLDDLREFASLEE